MLLKSFAIHKTFVDKVLLKTIKFERVFYYSNIHQNFSILLIYFIRRTKCVYIFKNMYWILWMNVVNFDLKHL